MTHNNELNIEQTTAVDTIDGPILVLAGAGSGKTRVVTFRIANLLDKGVAPSQILGLTFTNKAANEMKERVRRKTFSDVLICTFHSLGSRILRESIDLLGYRRNFTIYDEEDVGKLLKECTSSNGMEKELNSIRQMISQAKNNLLQPEQLTAEVRNSIFPHIYAEYQKKLKEYNAVDYDDLLFLVVRLFREFPDVLSSYQNRWTHLLIDEYQDTNAVQYTIVNLLVQKHRNLCVVGDPDQSIYSWRGANINNILDFENDYPGAKVIRLDQNYRSRSNILEAANAVIKNNSQRYEKKLWSTRGEGEPIQYCCCEDEKAEAAFIAERIRMHKQDHDIPYHEMVVFYRTNAQSRTFEDCFLQYRIPYVIVGGISFYQRREIKDVLAWLRMVNSSSDFLSFLRTINLPKRGLGASSLDKIRNGASEQQCEILQFCERLVAGEPMENPIKLTAAQKTGLKQYVGIVHALKQKWQDCTISELIDEAISTTGYREYLKEEKETYLDRIENLNALMAKAAEWEEASGNRSLSAFLEELTLKSNLDEINSDDSSICLMTLHNGKGLEFDVAFLAGMEEDLFPHINSRETMEGLEEERRLCYVGMTRAKEHLYLSSADQRRIWGSFRKQRPSRFLREIPNTLVNKVWVGSDRRSHHYNTPVKETASLPSGSMSQGDMVYHQEYGIGCINQIYQGQAGLTYKIFFSKENTEKNIVAKYAQLNKL